METMPKEKKEGEKKGIKESIFSLRLGMNSKTKKKSKRESLLLSTVVNPLLFHELKSRTRKRNIISNERNQHIKKRIEREVEPKTRDKKDKTKTKKTKTYIVRILDNMQVNAVQSRQRLQLRSSKRLVHLNQPD